MLYGLTDKLLFFMIPILIMTIGVQCSGKSTWAKKFASDNPEVVYLSTDIIWLSIGPMSDRSIAKKVYPILTKKVEVALQSKQSILIDATFIKKSWRKDFINIGRKYKARLIAHVFKADRDTLINRVQKRASEGGLNVPVEVIDKYIAQFQPPLPGEFDEIINH